MQPPMPNRIGGFLLPGSPGKPHVKQRCISYLPERHRFGLWHASHGREKREKPLCVLIIQSPSPFECA